MSGEPHSEPGAETTRAETGRGNAWRFQAGIRGLIVVVACCGVVAWSARTLWESQDPVADAARRLHYGTPARRAMVVRELKELGLDGRGPAVPPLIAAAGDPAAEVRIAAAEALGVVGGEDARARPAGAVGGVALGALIRSLKDREPSVRIAAMEALEHIATTPRPAATIDVPTIIDALAAAASDRDEEVRLVALKSLAKCGRLGPGRPPEAVVAALEDRSPRVRAAAILALASVPCDLDPWFSYLLRGLEDKDSGVNMACWMAFARAHPPGFSTAAIPALVAALESPSPSVRSNAAAALFPHASNPRAATAIPALLKLLEVREDNPAWSSPDWHRWSAAVTATRLLGQLAPGTPSAGAVVARLTGLMPTINSRFKRRWVTIEALGDFGRAAESAVPALAEALRRTHDPSTQGPLIVKALARIAPGTKSAELAVAALIEALDTLPSLQKGAIEALPAFGAKAVGVIPRLRELRKDRGVPGVDRAAAAALNAIEAATRKPGPSTHSLKRTVPRSRIEL
jgi:HEAT repeat protein